MDPDLNLAEQRALVAALIAAIDGEQPIDTCDVDSLCEHVRALDEWITRGGFLPAPWRRCATSGCGKRVEQGKSRCKACLKAQRSEARARRALKASQKTGA